MTAPDDTGPAGGAALELNADKTLVFLRFNRVACARMAEVLFRAAASPAGALKPGSEEAEDLTDYLNASLGRSEVAFGEVALDETLPDVRADHRPAADRVRSAAAISATALAVLALVRGLFALASDAWSLLQGATR